MVETALSKSVITGANGMLGSYFDFGFKTDKEIMDIRKKEEIEKVLKSKRPKYVFHLAALTDLELCEKNKKLALQINFQGTKNIAKICKEIRAKLIYISTAAVFTGKKEHNASEIPQPRNFYAVTKYLGEIAIQSILEDYLIIRTSWLFGGGPEKDKKFVSKILKQIEAKEKIRAVDDLYGSPTYCKDLVSAIKILVLKEEKGIFHIVNSGKASRYEISKEIRKILKKDIGIEAVSKNEFPSIVNRDHEVLKSDLHLRSWKKALKEYIEKEWLH